MMPWGKEVVKVGAVGAADLDLVRCTAIRTPAQVGKRPCIADGVVEGFHRSTAGRLTFPRAGVWTLGWCIVRT